MQAPALVSHRHPRRALSLMFAVLGLAVTAGCVKAGPPQPLGSGCTPRTSTLPDGRWFGYTGAVNRHRVRIDLACAYSGADATKAALEDGYFDDDPSELVSGVPNDHWERNENPTLRLVPIDGDTRFRKLRVPRTVATTRSDFIAHVDAERFPIPIWVTIDHGVAVRVVEQYFP